MSGEFTEFFNDEENFETDALSHVFEEKPVSLDEFLYSSDYLGFPDTPGLSAIQYEVLQYSERVYKQETFELMADVYGGYWEEVRDIRMTNQLNIMWGKGAGKDAVIRLAVLRVAYLLMCLRSPQAYFGMPESASIHMLNVAANAPQANRAFFEPMTKDVKRGWFATRAVSKKSSIVFNKNIEAISGHSSVDGQEGLNLIVGVADEIDAFKTRNEMVGLGRRSREASTSAESILNMLRSSAATRFPEVHKQITISFPRYKGSKIQQLVAEAKEDNTKYGRSSNLYASGPHATWEVNPLRKKSDFDLDYRKDPIEAAAKYECNPAASNNPFFRDPTIFEKSIDREGPAITVDYELVDVVSEETGVITRQWEPIYEFAEWFQPSLGAIYAMHGDLAIVGDHAGVAMSHVVGWIEKDVIFPTDEGTLETRAENLPIVRNDFTIAYKADIGSNPAREIKVRWARELAFILIKRGFNVVRYTFDQFQSADSRQILESAGIETDRVSTDLNNNVWRTVKDVASDGRLKMEKNAELTKELEALVDLGRKVDHPPSGGKDRADAFGCSIVGAIEIGGEEADGEDDVQVGGSIFNYGLDFNQFTQSLPSDMMVGRDMLPLGMTMEGPLGPN